MSLHAPIDAVVVPDEKSSPRPRDKQRPQRQPQYCVVLHNDAINRFAYVIDVLKRVFGYSQPKAFRITLTAHLKGRCDTWVGSLEVAELKADLIRSCGPDPVQLSAGSMPLTVTIERRP